MHQICGLATGLRVNKFLKILEVFLCFPQLMFVYLLIFENVSKITHPQQFGKGVEAIFDALKENTTLEKLMLEVSIH